MFWELYQQAQIQTAKDAAQDARRSTRSTEFDVAALQRRADGLEKQVQRLTLATMALAELLRDRLQVSQAEIEAKVRDIDLRDGKLDGKLATSVKTCPTCSRVNGPQRVTCLYCGTALPDDALLFSDQADR